MAALILLLCQFQLTFTYSLKAPPDKIIKRCFNPETTIYERRDDTLFICPIMPILIGDETRYLCYTMKFPPGAGYVKISLHGLAGGYGFRAEPNYIPSQQEWLWIDNYLSRVVFNLSRPLPYEKKGILCCE